MQPFSGLSLLIRGLSGQRGWATQWRSAEPRTAYDALLVGGGGHGLGAAYYLASEHRLTNIAVLEKGWIGGGNTGRNTTIIRSNYLFDESAALYDHAVRLWERLSQVLNYNVMFSQRGVMMLAHTVHDAQVFKRHVHANRVNGVDNEWRAHRSEEHTSELQSLAYLVCRLLLEKKNIARSKRQSTYWQDPALRRS